MSIETIIQRNTDVLMGLTEALIALERALNKSSAVTEKVYRLEEPEAVEEVKAEPVKVAEEVDYATVKALINKLALEHRDEIKQLNAKYGFKVFNEVLVDKEDISKGVKDQDQVRSYYAELTAIGE